MLADFGLDGGIDLRVVCSALALVLGTYICASRALQHQVRKTESYQH